MKFRGWLSLVTLVLLTVVVVAAWGDIREAFGYLARVNVWIIALMVPVQIISYIAVGEMIFSYLRAKGNLAGLNVFKVSRMALEFNFVNHVFPSGGAAGVAYLTWLLGKYGVSSGRSTMAQIVRFALTFLSFILMLVVALVILIIDHNIDRVTILLSLLLVVGAVTATLLGVFLISSKRRLDRFSDKLSRTVNRVTRKLTRGRKRILLRPQVVTRYFDDIHGDYLAIMRDKRILAKPFLWSIVANIMDVGLIFIAFWALGVEVNPAVIFIAYGLSSIAGALAVTPGGTGVYEAVMIAFLASAGLPADVAIAGTLLARVLLMLGTIAFGYIFYQLTILKYGRPTAER